RGLARGYTRASAIRFTAVRHEPLGFWRAIPEDDRLELRHAGDVTMPSMSQADADLREHDALRFDRPGHGVVRCGERIYVNPRPDAAALVAAEFIRVVLDDEVGFPGIQGFQIAGPDQIEHRADGLIIDVDDEQAAEPALRWLADLQHANPEWF